jgi:hypothetical protein
MIDAVNVTITAFTLRFMIADDIRDRRPRAHFPSKRSWIAISQ